MNSMTSVKDYYQYMSKADDNWFIQNSRFIAERDKNTQIHSPTRLPILASKIYARLLTA